MSADETGKASAREDRFEGVESRIAYQERALQELSDAVYRQEQLIEALESAVRLLTQRIAEIAEAMPEIAPDDDMPPHY